ncbi:MAG: hypothetical protein V4636_13195, partial [Pseudomonadota bacterium]
MWFVLAAICVLGTLGQSNIRLVGGTQATEPVTSESASDTLIEAFPGQAVAADPSDVPMDAAKPADESSDIAIDVVPAPPPPPPPAPPLPTRRQK